MTAMWKMGQTEEGAIRKNALIIISRVSRVMKNEIFFQRGVNKAKNNRMWKGGMKNWCDQIE